MCAFFIYISWSWSIVKQSILMIFHNIYIYFLIQWINWEQIEVPKFISFSKFLSIWIHPFSFSESTDSQGLRRCPKCCLDQQREADFGHSALPSLNQGNHWSIGWGTSLDKHPLTISSMLLFVRESKQKRAIKQILECLHLSAISKCSFPIMGFSTGSLHGGTGKGVVI